MANLYLGQYEWVSRNGEDFYWQAPGGDNIGSFDLRSLPECGTPGPVPQGVGLFVYNAPKVHSNLVVDLGSDMTANLTVAQKTAIRQFLKVRPADVVMDKVGEAIRQWCLDPTYWDAVGQNRHKPLLSSEFRVGGLGRLFTEPKASLQAAQVAVFQADYIRNREVSLMDPAILRKWTGATIQKLFGRMSDLDADAILPVKYRSDGWSPPQTTISDNFNRANESLDAGPWVEITGNWSVSSNAVIIAANAVAFARHTTALSSTDHKSKVTVTGLGTDANPGAACRMSTDASPNEDNYHAQLDNGGGNFVVFRKTVNSIRTILDTNTTVTFSIPDDVECETNGSTMISRFNNVVQHNFTDTSLTGQLNAGMALRRTGDIVDDFTAEDLAAASGRHPGTRTLALTGVGI